MVNFVLYVIRYCGYLFKLCVILSWTRTCNSLYNLTSITDVIDKSKILSTMEYLTNSEPRIWPTIFVIINCPIVKLSAPLWLGSHFWHISILHKTHLSPYFCNFLMIQQNSIYYSLVWIRLSLWERYCLELLW